MDAVFDLYGDALALRSRRMHLIASNIANASTPNYKARDLNFRSALEGAMRGDANAADRATSYRVPVQPSLDGNTVELSIEQTEFAENAVQYRTALSFLEGRLSTLRRAMKGE